MCSMLSWSRLLSCRGSFAFLFAFRIQDPVGGDIGLAAVEVGLGLGVILQENRQARRDVVELFFDERARQARLDLGGSAADGPDWRGKGQAEIAVYSYDVGAGKGLVLLDEPLTGLDRELGESWSKIPAWLCIY